MIIVLIGLPGSGKGTQAKLLSEKLHLTSLSTGDMFRKVVQNGGKEAAELSHFMAQGALVPSSLVSSIVQSMLRQDEYKNGCILDGYPRTIEQAEFLERIASHKIRAIYFDVADEIVLKRILGRYSCSTCGAIYNEFYAPTKEKGICDICRGGSFIKRDDDNEASIKNRLEVYKSETYPLITYYKNHKNCYSVDASKSTTEVAGELEKLIKKF